MAQWDPCYPHDIYVMDQKGERVKRLTSDHRSHNPSWSPDGRRIAFLEDECKQIILFNYTALDELRNLLSTAHDVYWMNADGRNSSLIARMGPKAQDTLWIPNGGQVAVRLANRSSLVVHMMKGSRFPRTVDQKNHSADFSKSRGIGIEMSTVKTQIGLLEPPTLFMFIVLAVGGC